MPTTKTQLNKLKAELQKARGNGDEELQEKYGAETVFALQSADLIAKEVYFKLEGDNNLKVEAQAIALPPLADLLKLVNIEWIIEILRKRGVEFLRGLIGRERTRDLINAIWTVAKTLQIPVALIDWDGTVKADQTEKFTARYSLEGGSFTWSIDSDPVNEDDDDRSFEYVFPTAKAYKLQLSVSAEGQPDVTDEITINVQANDAPGNVNIVANPQAPKVGQKVKFAVPGDPSPISRTAEWSFGDGTTAKGFEVEHTYKTFGTMTVTVKEGPQMGTLDLIVSPDIVVPGDIQISMNPPQPKAGQEITFTAQASPAIPTARWDFGDGVKMEGQSVKHTYKVHGDYTVTATHNQQSGSKQVQVAPAAGEPAPKRDMIVMFEEMRDNEEAHWEYLRERVQLLRRRLRDDGVLPPALEEELDNLYILFPQAAKVEPGKPVNLRPHVSPLEHPDGKTPLDFMQDKVFKALVETLRGDDEKFDPDWHIVGVFRSQTTPDQMLSSSDIEVAAIYGILERERTVDVSSERRFQDALARARGEFKTHRKLFRRVLSVLIEEGRYTIPDTTTDPGGTTGIVELPDEYWTAAPIFQILSGNRDKVRKVSGEKWASVVRQLVQDGVSETTNNLDLLIRQALYSLAGKDDNAEPSAIDIDLPDLEQQVDVEIITENVRAMQAILFAATLEELKLFQVRDKLLELFQQGMLPVVRGRAGDLLYRQMKKSVTRLSEFERRNLYARTLGFAGGESNGSTNRDFQMLWLRFTSAVSSFARQLRVDSLLRAEVPARVHQEQVRKAGRDLAANLSLYGYGMAYFVATELQSEISEIIDVLSDSELRGSYGARDMWGVIDQIAALELGGARDSVRYRTMASASAVIVAWLAINGQRLSSISYGDILDIGEIARPAIRPKGQKITKDPYDSDLVNACEQWLAVTGTAEAQIQQYSEPIEGPATPSRPINIPSFARDMLESVGFKGNGFGD